MKLLTLQAKKLVFKGRRSAPAALSMSRAVRDFDTFKFFQFLRLLRCLIDLKKFYTIRVGDFCSIMVEHPKSVFQERKANHPRGGGNNNIVSKLSIELKACIAFFEQTKNI